MPFVTGPEGVTSTRPTSEPLWVWAQVEEAEGVLRPKLGGFFLERALVGELLDPLACPDREVVAALWADAQIRRELVVAVVRPAGRACVRVLLFVLRRSSFAAREKFDNRENHQLAFIRSQYDPVVRRFNEIADARSEPLVLRAPQVQEHPVDR